MSEGQSKRVQRVQRELFETLSHFLQHRLPTPLPCHAAISAVDVSPDLRQARVHFRLVGGDDDVHDAQQVLQSERPSFQKHVAHELQLKFTPVLRFEFGVAPQLDEIDALFEKLNRDRYGEWNCRN
jgi:ribosome-binding factor A